MIELVHLVKKFGDLVAVNDVTLTIPRGEFFAMLGPERRRQNHHAENSRRPDEADRRLRARLRF